MKANGYRVVFAADGVTSISAARTHEPSLILLDLGLPAGDGFSVMERLNASDTMSLIPVIVLSARDRNANRDRAIKAGARAFLQKPVETSELLAAVRLALGAETPRAETVYNLDGPRNSALSDVLGPFSAR